MAAAVSVVSGGSALSRGDACYVAFRVASALQLTGDTKHRPPASTNPAHERTRAGRTAGSSMISVLIDELSVGGYEKPMSVASANEKPHFARHIQRVYFPCTLRQHRVDPVENTWVCLDPKFQATIAGHIIGSVGAHCGNADSSAYARLPIRWRIPDHPCRLSGDRMDGEYLLDEEGRWLAISRWLAGPFRRDADCGKQVGPKIEQFRHPSVDLLDIGHRKVTPADTGLIREQEQFRSNVQQALQGLPRSRQQRHAPGITQVGLIHDQRAIAVEKNGLDFLRHGVPFGGWPVCFAESLR